MFYKTLHRKLKIEQQYYRWFIFELRTALIKPIIGIIGGNNSTL